MDNLLHKRNSSLDIARIFAVFAVVMIHCSAPFIEDFKTLSSEFIIGSIFNGISRLGVPLFLMISGALFLDERKEITIKGVLLKNVKNIAIITIIWSTLYSVIYNIVPDLISGEAFDFKTVLADIIKGHYHMWYLYMIIGLYIITPFLKKFVCKENRNEVLFFILISFTVQFLLPMLHKVCEKLWNIKIIGTFTDKFFLDFFGGYITYFLLGWYIVHIGINKKVIRYIIYSFGGLSLVTMITYVNFTGAYKIAYQNIGVPVLFYAVSVFLAFNNIKLRLNDKTAKLTAELSKLTFGVYLIHVLILDTIKELLPYSKNPVLYILACFLAVTCSSFIISFTISKIPVIKKIIKA